MNNSPLPPDVVGNIIEVLGYLASVALGWVAKWLQGRKTKNVK